MWDKRRPGDPREAAFLWVPGGSSAEPQGLRHTHTAEPADLAALDLSFLLAFPRVRHLPGSQSTPTRIHPRARPCIEKL